MKKIFIFLFAMALLISCAAQDTVHLSMSKEDYLEKSHNQLVTGKIMMGIGIGALTGGIIYTIVSLADATLRAFDGGTEQISAGGPILMVGGAGLMLGSIPVFLASGRNHKNAMSIHTSTGTIDFFKQSKFGNPYYPAVSLVIPIGRK